MIIVTGGAGFIGSNIVKALNERQHRDIVVVDDLSDGTKFVNLVDCEIMDYLDIDEFLKAIIVDTLSTPDIIFHNGACSSTTEQNGKYMLQNNFTMSKELLHFCNRRKVPLIYASSAAVYGDSGNFAEDSQSESPLNIYGYSKLLFDRYVRAHANEYSTQVVGLRYFNVYGPREQHKKNMASVAYHHHMQVQRGENPRLFGEYDGCEAGLQKRDFIHVDDIVEANLWFFQHPEVSGTFNVGTGRAEPFIEIAAAVISFYGKGKIEFVEFPELLKGSYQSYTCADISKLRDAGFDHEFKTVAQGVRAYMEWLNR